MLCSVYNEATVRCIRHSAAVNSVRILSHWFVSGMVCIRTRNISARPTLAVVSTFLSFLYYCCCCNNTATFKKRRFLTFTFKCFTSYYGFFWLIQNHLFYFMLLWFIFFYFLFNQLSITPLIVITRCQRLEKVTEKYEKWWKSWKFCDVASPRRLLGHLYLVTQTYSSFFALNCFIQC